MKNKEMIIVASMFAVLVATSLCPGSPELLRPCQGARQARSQ